MATTGSRKEEAAFDILVVDDNEDLRDELQSGLEHQGHRVTAVATGEAAVELVRRNPNKYDFALIDQILHEDKERQPESKRLLNGIGTAVELLKVNREIGTIIYSAQVGLEEDALSKGVHRYLRKDKKELKDIEMYLKEIRGLSNLQRKLDELHEKQEVLGSLTLGLNVGWALIDRKYRVWYMDDRYRELVGKPHIQPGLCYQVFHDYDFEDYEDNEDEDKVVCHNCPIKETFKTDQRMEDYFFNPFAHGELKYIYTAADPVFDASGKVIGAIKSVVELKEGPILAAMDLEAHKALILRSLYQRGKNTRRGYGRIRLFEPRSKDGRRFWQETSLNEAGKAAASGSVVIEFNSPEIQALEEHGQDQGFIKIPPDGLSSVPLLYFFLKDQGEYLGLLLVEQHQTKYHLDRSDLPAAGDYAQALARVLAQAPQRAMLAQSHEWDRELAEFRLRLAQAKETKEALKLLLDEVMRITGAEMGHIRTYSPPPGECQKLAYEGEYGKAALEVIDVYVKESATAQVIHSQQPLIFADIEPMRKKTPEKLPLLFSLLPDNPLLQKIRSMYIMPLVYLGKCYGFIKLMSPKKGNFQGLPEERLTPLWQLLSYTLHDHIRHEEYLNLIEEGRKCEVDKLILAQQTIHGINSPAMNMRFYLKGLKEFLQGARDLTPGEAAAACEKAEVQLARIENLCASFQRLLKPLPERLEVLDFTDFSASAVQALEQAIPGARVEFRAEVQKVKVRLDPDSFREALLELGRNAQKAAAAPGREPLYIKLTLRRPAPTELPGVAATVEDWVLLSFRDNGPGVPSEVREHLFQPWISSYADSSGLGLSIVKKVVEDHGGAIALADTGDQWVTFHIVMPIYQE